MMLCDFSWALRRVEGGCFVTNVRAATDISSREGSISENEPPVAIRGAFVDMTEMLQRAGRISKKLQCDPARHKMKFGTVIGIGGWCGLSHYPIGGLCIAEIDKLAGKQATFAPPFVGVLSRVHLGLSACVVH